MKLWVGDVIGTYPPHGRVKQATWTRPSDGQKLEVAVKVIKKKVMHGDVASVFAEMHVLEGLDHPNIGECFVFLPCSRRAPRLRCFAGTSRTLTRLSSITNGQSSSTTLSKAGRSGTLSSSSHQAESCSSRFLAGASSRRPTRCVLCAWSWLVYSLSIETEACEATPLRDARGKWREPMSSGRSVVVADGRVVIRKESSTFMRTTSSTGISSPKTSSCTYASPLAPLYHSCELVVRGLLTDHCRSIKPGSEDLVIADFGCVPDISSTSLCASRPPTSRALT